MNRRIAIELSSESEGRTMDIAALLGERLVGGELIALEGPLGSGKTCFVRGLARGMGIDPSAVSSPTFVLCQEYSVREPSGARPDTLAHIDAYRLRGADELESIGWSELRHDGSCVIAIEWPSRAAEAVAGERIDVSFEHSGPLSRTITITGPSHIVAGLGDSFDAASRPCPTCGQLVGSASSTFPFCSKRCRLADLGAWFNESYRVVRPAELEDQEAGD